VRTWPAASADAAVAGAEVVEGAGSDDLGDEQVPLRVDPPELLPGPEHGPAIDVATPSQDIEDGIELRDERPRRGEPRLLEAALEAHHGRCGPCVFVPIGTVVHGMGQDGALRSHEWLVHAGLERSQPLGALLDEPLVARPIRTLPGDPTELLAAFHDVVRGQFRHLSGGGEDVETWRSVGVSP
jgi:hypothetical protein